MGKVRIGALSILNLFVGLSKVKSIFFGNTKVYEATDAWEVPQISLNGDILETSYVEGVTKYKVYSNGTYIGYVDSDNVWHGEVEQDV